MAKVLLSLPDPFLEEVDRLARASHRSRSELIRDALHHYLARAASYPAPGEDPEVREALALYRRSPVGGSWDSTREVRAVRKGRGRA